MNHKKRVNDFCDYLTADEINLSHNEKVKRIWDSFTPNERVLLAEKLNMKFIWRDFLSDKDLFDLESGKPFNHLSRSLKNMIMFGFKPI